MAEWIQSVRIAFTVTLTLLVVLLLSDSLYKHAFFRGEVAMLQKCRLGFPACRVPIVPTPPRVYPAQPPVTKTQIEDVSWLTREFL